MKRKLFLVLALAVLVVIGIKINKANAYSANYTYHFWKCKEMQYKGQTGVMVYFKDSNFTINGHNVIPGITTFKTIYVLTGNSEIAKHFTGLSMGNMGLNIKKYSREIVIFNKNGTVKIIYSFLFFPKYDNRAILTLIKQNGKQLIRNFLRNIAVFYWHGIYGLNENHKKAIYWLKKAAHFGSKKAIRLIQKANL
ncbi:MAG: hypothetical protein ACYCTD_05325 [bacterium]